VKIESKTFNRNGRKVRKEEDCFAFPIPDVPIHSDPR